MIVLEAQTLTKHFSTSDGKTVHAVDGIDMALTRGTTTALVGESGSGKSTFARTLARLMEPTSGQILLQGTDISTLDRRALRPHRSKVQMVFQDPFASLNPRMSVFRILEEPLIAQGQRGRTERRERIEHFLNRVGIRADGADRYPHEFSGGQRQRICIARALILDPIALICDEPVSALDVSIRAQIINLLSDLRQEFGLATLFVSHDLSVVRHVADEVAVMYLGRIVEQAPRRSFWINHSHPYTRALVASVPIANPAMVANRQRTPLGGDPPSPIDMPAGCRFSTRCPFAIPRCRTEEPLLRVIEEGHHVACHRTEELRLDSPTL